MRYVNIPMVDKAYPRAEWVAAFMQTVDDPLTGKFFVHCAGGLGQKYLRRKALTG